MSHQQPRPWLAFAVLATAIFLTILDLTIVNVALPAVAEDFPGTPLPELSWTLTLYAVVFAAALVPAGKAGDLYGRRRMFVVGTTVFLAGSALAALAPTPLVLYLGRGVQAVGAAAMTPNSLAAVLPVFPPARRPHVLAVWGGIAGIGAAAGPPLGGLLADLDWRLIFVVNIPVGLVALALTRPLVPEIRDPAAARLPDVTGAITLAAAMGALILGLSQGSAWHWDLRVLASLVVAAAGVAVVAHRSRRHPAPIIEPDLVRDTAFRLLLAGTVTAWAAFCAVLAASAIFLAGAWDYPVLEAGLALTPGPALSSASALLSPRLGGRVGHARVAATGAVLMGAGALVMAAGLEHSSSYAAVFLPAQLLVGIGFGFLPPNLMALTVRGLPPARLSTGISVYTIFRQLGAAAGVAAWVAVIGSGSLAVAGSYDAGWVLVAVLSAATAGLLHAVGRAATPQPGRAGSPPSRSVPSSPA